LEGRISELQSVISRSEVIDIGNGPRERVEFGCTVVLYNTQTDEEEVYQLVGPYESNPGKNQISIASPLGQALIGRLEGDEVKVKTPGGIREYEIIEIR
jgi:transcription elongation factor GreA